MDIYNFNTWSTTDLSQAWNDLLATSVENLVLFAGGTDYFGHPSSVVDNYNFNSNTRSTVGLFLAQAFLAATCVGNLVFNSHKC